MHYDSNTPDTIPYGMKRCGKCKQVLAVAMFVRDSSRSDGLKPSCRDCHNAKKRKYYAANREILAERSREYRLANPEKAARHARQYREANRGKDAERARRYYSANKDKVAERVRQYHEANPEIHRIARRNRRARTIANGGTVTAGEWQGVLARFDGKCAKCGSSEDIHMDHVVPLAKGGKHSVDNIQPLCATCNTRKFTKVEDYRGRMYRPLALPLDDQGES